MPTTPDPTGRPSTANLAAPVPSSNDRPSVADPNPLPLPANTGSTGSHKPNHPLSDLISPNGVGSSSQRSSSAESDIAQFLAHPQGGAVNTDDAPTVITQNKPNAAPQPAPVSLPVTGEPPSIAGRRLGHFELIEAIGAGGMAAVLKARDLELGRIVALKILPPEAARDPESVNRFKQEARAAAKLDHDNVARVYFCGEDQGLHFIAFEFVEGDNLRVLIDRRGPLTAIECVPYMMQVAAGLNHAAERGVVHRDIKPSNILITPDGRAKIVDMGLARYLGSEMVNGGVTQSGVTLGTFDYISPEQALDPRRADVRSDIYSLGCTFYHALTGRPPVPEGTAARKLRAHQNDEPLDPRELNPAIPDELAAILAHMMAKSQAARYQTPTELIAHLKGLAEWLKLSGDALAHDSAAKSVPAARRLLPEAPRVRAWWMAAVAAVALAVAAFVVATSNPGPAPGLPGTDQAKTKAPEVPFEKGDPGLPREAHPMAGAVRTVEELAARLEDAKATGKVQVQLAAVTFDLTALKHPLVFQGKGLELVGAPGGGTRVILTASATRPAPMEIGTFTVKADTIAVRNVWFDLKAAPTATDEDEPAALFGLRLDEATHITLEDCVFAANQLQNYEPRSIAVSRSVEGQQQIDLTRCLFASGFVGMAVPTGAKIAVSDCGFGSLSAAVSIEGTSGTADMLRSAISLGHSSFMLRPGECVVETGAPANVAVTAADCVFAPAETGGRSPFSSSEANRRGVVIRVRGEPPPPLDNVALTAANGRTNAYYNVDPLGTSQSTFTVEQCKAEANKVEDKGRVDLKQRPWSETDLLVALGSESPWKAFRLKVDADAEPAVFSKNERQQWVPLGVAFHQAESVRRAYTDIPWPPPRPRTTVEARQKVWVPEGKDDELAPGEYSDLRKLLKAVHPDEVILIRHTGLLKVDKEEIKAATKPSDTDIRVTFRPAPGSVPILVSLQGDSEIDQSLFKLKSGEVTFEHLNFVLKPTRAKSEVVSAVAIAGGRSCTFRDCVFTLAESDDAQAAVVSLPDVSKLMMLESTARVPKVIFDHCLIRGKGRAVWAQVSRPVNLEMTNTLTALDGPVLLAEAGDKAASGASAAKFTRVTALAGGPIVEMHGGKTADAMRPGGLTMLKVDADECLFIAVKDAGRPLVELNGVNPTEWKSVLSWQVTKGNRYANFDAPAVLAVIQSGSEGAVKEWTRNDWISNVGESPVGGGRFGTMTFAAPSAGLKELAALKPADLVPKMLEFADLSGAKALDVGVDPLDLKKLPLPPDEPKPE